MITKTSQRHDKPTECEVSVEAQVEFIRRKSQISITVDGVPLTEFSFNRETGKISFKLTADDSTMLKIMLVNSAGDSSDELEIKCDK
jgi:hypothetical protein